MGYKVRVQTNYGHPPLKRDYGTGKEGKGGAYVSRAKAELRLRSLRKEFNRGDIIVKLVRA